MKRRSFLASTAVVAAVPLVSTSVAGAIPLKGRIRKSLKWGMVQDKTAPVVEAFRKLRACGFEGVEPRMDLESEGGKARKERKLDVDEWIAASKETGLVIDCMTGGRPFNLIETIDILKKLGGDSILATVPGDALALALRACVWGIAGTAALLWAFRRIEIRG